MNPCLWNRLRKSWNPPPKKKQDLKFSKQYACSARLYYPILGWNLVQKFNFLWMAFSQVLGHGSFDAAVSAPDPWPWFRQIRVDFRRISTWSNGNRKWIIACATGYGRAEKTRKNKIRNSGNNLPVKKSKISNFLYIVLLPLRSDFYTVLEFSAKRWPEHYKLIHNVWWFWPELQK